MKLKGKIKTVNSRGFGFITTDNDIDWFFHFSSFDGPWKRLVAMFVNSPNQSLLVEFDSDPTAEEAPRAINVRLVNHVSER